MLGRAALRRRSTCSAPSAARSATCCWPPRPAASTTCARAARGSSARSVPRGPCSASSARPARAEPPARPVLGRHRRRPRHQRRPRLRRPGHRLAGAPRRRVTGAVLAALIAVPPPGRRQRLQLPALAVVVARRDRPGRGEVRLTDGDLHAALHPRLRPAAGLHRCHFPQLGTTLWTTAWENVSEAFRALRVSASGWSYEAGQHQAEADVRFQWPSAGIGYGGLADVVGRRPTAARRPSARASGARTSAGSAWSVGLARRRGVRRLGLRPLDSGTGPPTRVSVGGSLGLRSG